MSAAAWTIYGANGYTGELCAREAVRRGERPILAGRNRPRVEALARELDLESRVFALDDPAALAAGLAGTAAVLHCAGPFVLTGRPMMEACLAGGVHYLDITGEIAVFETAHRLAARAEEAGVVLLPGVGFDVVPSDCLAARLAAALPDAVRLDLAFAGEGASWSRGTLKTAIESLPHAGAVRRGGVIVPVPPADATRQIDFPALGRRLTATIPWGDVSTAYHTTGIPDVRVFTAMPPAAVRRLKRLAPLLPLAGWKPVKRLLQWHIGRTVTGPDAAARERGRIHLWGEAANAAGATVQGSTVTPEGYSFTATASVECTRRVLAGQVAAGTHTPAAAFGAGFAAELPGVEEGETVRVEPA